METLEAHWSVVSRSPPKKGASVVETVVMDDVEDVPVVAERNRSASLEEGKCSWPPAIPLEFRLDSKLLRKDRCIVAQCSSCSQRTLACNSHLGNKQEQARIRAELLEDIEEVSHALRGNESTLQAVRVLCLRAAAITKGKLEMDEASEIAK